MILQARILEWVAISFSRGSSWPRNRTRVSWIAGRWFTKWAMRKWKWKKETEVAQSCPTLCHPWTVAYQVPPSMWFSRQEYWSGLPFPFPGDLPNSGIEPRSPAFQADAGKPNLSNNRKILPDPLPVWFFSTPWSVHEILQARVLEWVAFPFSRGSSQPREWTQVSCIAGGIFTSWATWEAPKLGGKP